MGEGKSWVLMASPGEPSIGVTPHRSSSSQLNEYSAPSGVLV